MISWSMITEKGMREHNEDKVGYRQIGQRYCFVLADGLGGHGKGEVASKLVVDTILSEFEIYSGTEEFLHRAICKAQNVLLERQKLMNCRTEMKTTVVCLVVDDKKVQWAFCGDSRLYYWYKNKILQRTLDHSVPQMLVLAKQLKEKKIRFHEDRNRLLRVLGMECDKQVFEILPQMDMKGGQKFLMCTDGFWEYVSENDMKKSLKKAANPDMWIENMQKLVLKNGQGHDMDNYSAIAIWICEK